MTAAGTAAQAAGARKAQKAMAGAREAERIRQKGYQSESDAAFNESMSQQGADLQKQKIAQAEADRTATAQGAQQQAAVVNIPTQGDTPTIVSDETSARVGVGNAQAAQEAANRAALASFGDVQLGNALMNTRYGQQQAQIGRNMQGSANVLGVEMENASRRGDSLKGIGSGLVAGGSLLGMGAGMGLGAAAAPAASTAANSITQSSILPTTSGMTELSSYGMDPNWFRLGNPNHWTQNLNRTTKIGF
jgi:vacuolar-type H+-ATPase subunit F/Vma7